MARGASAVAARATGAQATGVHELEPEASPAGETPLGPPD